MFQSRKEIALVFGAKSFLIGLSLALPILAAHSAFAGEEEAKSKDQQDFLEALIQQSGMTPEQLKAAGMTPEMLQQINQQMKNSGAMQIGAQAQQVEQDRRQAKFDARTEGMGTVDVSFGGEQYLLSVTVCEYLDDKGSFAINAQETAKNLVDGTLVVNHAVGSNSKVSFWVDENEYLTYADGFDFDGKSLEWAGSVNTPNGKTPLSFSARCGT